MVAVGPLGFALPVSPFSLIIQLGIDTIHPGSLVLLHEFNGMYLCFFLLPVLVLYISIFLFETQTLSLNIVCCYCLWKEEVIEKGKKCTFRWVQESVPSIINVCLLSLSGTPC